MMVTKTLLAFIGAAAILSVEGKNSVVHFVHFNFNPSTIFAQEILYPVRITMTSLRMPSMVVTTPTTGVHNGQVRVNATSRIVYMHPLEHLSRPLVILSNYAKIGWS